MGEEGGRRLRFEKYLEEDHEREKEATVRKIETMGTLMKKLHSNLVGVIGVSKIRKA